MMKNSIVRFFLRSDDRSFSDKETGLLDQAVRQFRGAIYAVGNKTMTVDEAVSSYGSIPEE